MKERNMSMDMRNKDYKSQGYDCYRVNKSLLLFIFVIAVRNIEIIGLFAKYKTVYYSRKKNILRHEF